MKYKGLLLSILFHVVLFYCLTRLSPIKYVQDEQPQSLSTYIIPVEQQREILARFEQEKKPEIKPQKELNVVEQSEILDRKNNQKVVAQVIVQPKSDSQVQKEPSTSQDELVVEELSEAPDNKKENREKGVKRLNPYAAISSVARQSHQEYVSQQSLSHQVGAPKQFIATPKHYANYNSTQKIASLNNGRSIVKWRGKCYIMDANSAMGSADMPSSGGGLCPGEKSDDEVLLKKSLDKWLAN